MKQAAMLLLVAACGGGSDSPPVPAGDKGAVPAPPTAPADSLALEIGDAEVWYTMARPGRADDGSPCVDRALEIRRGADRIPVPLLYTGTAPERVDDTTFRARLSDHCAPGARYLVNVRTGRPTPER